MCQYSVTYKEKVVGTARVTQAGLYYHIECSCQRPVEGMLRLIVCCEKAETDLGIGIPQNNNLQWNTNVAKKHIGSGTLKFILSTEKTPLRFIAIDPHKPFVEICRLEEAKYYEDQERVGVMIPLIAE